MKNVLYITYYFPPSGGSGVQRGLKFSKYLSEFGWNPIILCADSRFLKQPKDFSLLQEVSKSLSVYRSFTLDVNWLFKIFWGLRLSGIVQYLQHHLFVPDTEIIWLPFARRKIREIVKINRIDLVYISGPPFSPMILGKWIKDRYNIPYILDFRDDWSLGQSRLDNPPPYKFQRKDKHLESLALEYAEHVTVVIKTYIEDFVKNYSFMNNEKLTAIPNGYDEADFYQIVTPPYIQTNKMRIVFPGALYDRRHPAPIWKALLSLVNEKRVNPNSISIEIIGNNFSSFVFRGFEKEVALKQMVSLHPYLPHSKAIETMMKSDLLLLFSASGPRSEAVLPGKLFEYIRCGIPILGVTNPDGLSAELLRECGYHNIVSPDDVDGISRVIMDLYTLWQNGSLRRLIYSANIKRYERRELTKQLAYVFDKVIYNPTSIE